jgi:2-polyprenyl-6-methoxyphenol hydroxylase-like FAD-dependent oxidoreductase
VRADVIVVGAGPVGLMLAGELRLGGAKVAVYDRLPAPSGESRALGFTKRVAELFDQRGLLTRLGDIRWGRQGHFGGVRIDLGMLADNHRGVLGLPQSRTEEMLGAWLGELGAPVRRGYEIVGLRETADEVVAVFDGPQGPHEEPARYLAGCDGGQSTTRALAGIEAHGWEATRGTYMADITGVELPQRPVGERIPGGNMVLSVSLGDGYYRLVIQDRSLPARPDPATLTFADVADTWQRLTGESIHNAQARWVWACGNAAALAAEYRRGRVFLAGDAAHDLPPLAGWGLSTGIQDAVNLGWKLAAELRGHAPPGLLDTYHAERHPLGQQLLRNTHAASMLYLTGEEMEPVRDVMRELVTYPSAAAHLAGMVSGLSVRYEMGGGAHPLLGLRLPPDRELDLPGGRRVRVAELLRPARGLFIGAGSSPGAGQLACWPASVEVITGNWVPANGTGTHLPLGSVLVRPDGYIAWAGPGTGDLPGALSRWFGPARRVNPGSWTG